MLSASLNSRILLRKRIIFCNMNNIENLVLQAVKDTIDGDFQGCIREYGIAADVAQLTEYELACSAGGKG